MSLMDLSDKQFDRLVAEDVKKRLHPSEAAELRRATYRERWLASLRRTHETVTQEIADLRTTYDAESAPYAEDPVMLNILRDSMVTKLTPKETFQFHVERRLAEAEREEAIASTDDTLVVLLREAISNHRDAYEHTDDLYIMDADRELWKVLDGEV